VILLASQGCTRVEIARLTGFSLPVITCWCQRFQAQRLKTSVPVLVARVYQLCSVIYK
jgi:hypothetical protein